MFKSKIKIILNKIFTFFVIFVFIFTSLPYNTFLLISNYLKDKKVVDELYLSERRANMVDNLINKKVQAALNHYTPNSQNLINGTESNITSATGAAAGGTNIGSWRGTLSNDNFHWTTTGTGTGINTQLNVDNVFLNGANKIEFQTEVDLDAAVSLQVQVCDWVSSVGVDHAVDAQCTGGGWRSLNTRNTSNAIVGLTTITTPVSLRWHIYDGYFVTGTSPGTPISTPLTNFISNDSNKRVKVRYYSTTASAVIDIDYLKVRPFIDSVYEPADFVRLNSGGSVTGYYINANGPFGNTATAQIDTNAHDGAYIIVPGTTTASEFYFVYKNIKTYGGMNTILVKSDYSCANTGINMTPRIYNFNTSSWENLTSQTIACNATDTATPSVWAKNNITVSNYINASNEIRVGWLGSSSNAAAHLRVDSMYIILGTTNTDTAGCEIPIGTGTVTDCSNTRDIDTLGTPTTWDITAEDESTNIGAGEANSYYALDIDNDNVASEEGASAHIPFSVTLPSNAQVTGNHFALRFIGRSAGTTAVMQAGLKDYGGYNTNSTGGFLAIGTTSSTTAGAYLYEDSISARSNTTNSNILSATTYGQQQNPEDYVHTGLNEMRLRLRTSTDGASTDNNTPKWDFAFVSLQWIEPEETGPSRTYHFSPTSQTIVNGTENNVTAQSTAAAAGINLGSWRATLADDNLHWSVLSTTSGINIQLNSDGVSLNGANKIEIQTEVDLDAAHAMLVQICDWVSATSVDDSADAQCTGGGWRTINTQNASNANVALTTTTTPVSLRWHIYDGYFNTGSTGGTPISTPLTNFISQDANKRVKVRYYSTLNNTTNSIDIDYLRIMPFIDSFYEPANFTRLNSGGTVSGTYVNANQIGNTTTNIVTVTTHDATYITVPGTTTASEFYFSYNNVKTYEGMNTILVQSDYSCAATGINITPRIYNFNTSSWENLSSTTIACSASDVSTMSVWAKNNINIDHYVSNGEIRVGWIGSSAHATAYPRVDAMPIILGTTNTDTAGCEIPIGTGTVADCANTRNIDTLSGSPSYWAIAAEDESTNMGQGEANSYYAFDIDNDATASEEGAAGHLKLSLTVPDLAQVVGMHYATRIQGRTAGTTAAASSSLRDYSSYNTASTGGFLNYGTASSSTSYSYSDSLFNMSATGMGFQFNAEDYIHTGRNELELRLRNTTDSAAADNNNIYWDFAMIGLNWLDTSCVVRQTGTWSDTSFSATPFDQGSGCRGDNSNVRVAGEKENLVVNSGSTLTLDSNTPVLEKVRIYGTIDTNGYTLNAKNIEIMSGGVLVLDNSTVNISGTTGTLITNNGTFTAGTSTVNITGNGNTTLNSGNIDFYNLNISSNGIKTLGSGFNVSNTLTLSAGLLDSNNIDFDLGSLVVNGGSFNGNSSTIQLVNTGTVFSYTSGDLYLNKSTIKISDTSNTSKTFDGGNGAFGTLWLDGGNGGGSYTISGSNIFNVFKDTGTASHSINFTSGTSQTFQNMFNVSGVSGQPIIITSNNTSTHSLVNTTINNINVDYVSVAHSIGSSNLALGESFQQITSAGSRNWRAIDSSLDGTKIVASVNNGYIYTSTNGGVSWTERTNAGVKNWYGVSISDDGLRMVATPSSLYIHTSSDGGITWTERTSAGSRLWCCAASSGDGLDIVAAVANGYIYTSNDGGASWTERTNAGSRVWNSLSMSSNGQYIVAAVANGYIYTSNDGGVNWTERTNSGSRNWKYVEISENGINIVGNVYGGYIYTSNDGGASWTERTNAGSRNWYGLAMSNNGDTIVAGNYPGYVYVSLNNGANWSEYTSLGSKSWYDFVLSENGTKLVGIIPFDYMNMSQNTKIFVADTHSINNNSITTAGSGWIFNIPVSSGSSNIEPSADPDAQQEGGGAGGGGGTEGSGGGDNNQGGGGSGGGGGDIGYLNNKYLASAIHTNYYNIYLYFLSLLILASILIYKKLHFK